MRHFKGDPVFKSFAPFYSTLNRCVLPSLKYVFQKHNCFLHNLYFLKLIALKIKINHILWRKNIAYYQSLKLNAIARNNKMLESEIGLFRSKYFCNRNDRKKIGFPETRFCNLFFSKVSIRGDCLVLVWCASFLCIQCIQCIPNMSFNTLTNCLMQHNSIQEDDIKIDR